MTEPTGAGPGTYATADDFLNDRRDELSVHTCEVEPGCWDVVLRLDGTYFDREKAEQVAASFARDIRYLLAGGTSTTTDSAERPPSARAQQAIDKENQ